MDELNQITNAGDQLFTTATILATLGTILLGGIRIIGMAVVNKIAKNITTETPAKNEAQTAATETTTALPSSIPETDIKHFLDEIRGEIDSKVKIAQLESKIEFDASTIDRLIKDAAYSREENLKKDDILRSSQLELSKIKMQFIKIQLKLREYVEKENPDQKDKDTEELMRIDLMGEGI